MSYNITRITGMYSGLDIDSLVKDLIKVESMKVDKVKQQKQYIEWQQEAYRGIINLLRGFKDEYFSYTNSSTNFRSSSTFSGYEVSLADENDSRYIEITGQVGALTGSYTISNITTAKSARAVGTALSSGTIEGTNISSFDINSTNDNNKITVTFNGVSKEITVDDNPADINALQNDLQAKIDAAFGSGKITVGAPGSYLTFSTSNTNTLSIDYAYNSGYDTLLGKNLSSGITLDNQNNKLNVDLAGNSQDIILNTGSYADDEAVQQELQSKIDTAFGSNKIRVVNSGGVLSLKAVVDGTQTTASNNGWDTLDVSSGVTVDGTTVADNFSVTVDGQTYDITLEQKAYTKDEIVSAVQSKVDSNSVLVTLGDTGVLRFESISSDTLSTGRVENTGLEALGLDTVHQSNKIDLDANLADIADVFNTTLIPNDSDSDLYDIEFTINGERFEFDSASTSLNEIISAVNSNANADVYMRYDELNDNIIIESKDTGAAASISISDNEGNLMAVLGLNGINENGTDASIVLDDGSGPQTITRSSNSFTINGISYEVKEDYAGTIDFSIKSDPDVIIEKIKGFVEKYNEVIEEINGKLVEKRYYDYKPLTEEQKEELTEDEIEMWEEKAKSGILRSDTILQGIVRNMRNVLYESVDGIALYNIGITTSSSYTDKGKLVIDEDKLRDAIENNPDQIVNLFSKDEEGLAHKLYDILELNISTSTNSDGRKGILLEKAGIEGDRTVSNNFLSYKIDQYNDQIAELTDELTRKENYYYEMFAKMERALAEMNSQMSFFMGQTG